MFHKVANNNVRPLIKSVMPQLVDNIRITRSIDIYKNFPRVNELYYNSFIFYFTRSWNCLERSIRNELNIGIFKEKIKEKLKPPNYRHYKYGYNLSAKEFDCRNITITYAVQTHINSTKR